MIKKYNIIYYIQQTIMCGITKQMLTNWYLQTFKAIGIWKYQTQIYCR